MPWLQQVRSTCWVNAYAWWGDMIVGSIAEDQPYQGSLVCYSHLKLVSKGKIINKFVARSLIDSYFSDPGHIWTQIHSKISLYSSCIVLGRLLKKHLRHLINCTVNYPKTCTCRWLWLLKVHYSYTCVFTTASDLFSMMSYQLVSYVPSQIVGYLKQYVCTNYKLMWKIHDFSCISLPPC